MARSIGGVVTESHRAGRGGRDSGESEACFAIPTKAAARTLLRGMPSDELVRRAGG